MPKYTTDDDNQPELIAEPRADYAVTPEFRKTEEFPSARTKPSWRFPTHPFPGS